MKLKVVMGVLVLGFIVGVFLSLNRKAPILVIDDFEGVINSSTVDYGVGSGSEIAVTGDKDVVYHGKQSLKVEYNAIADGYMWVARGYRLDVKGAALWQAKPEKINWKKYEAISFYMYGENTGASIAVDIIDKDYEYFRFMVKDDFSGWKQVVCPFAQFFARGDWQPDKAGKNGQLDFPVYAFQLEPRPIAKGKIYLDYVQLLPKSK